MPRAGCAYRDLMNKGLSLQEEAQHCTGRAHASGSVVDDSKDVTQSGCLFDAAGVEYGSGCRRRLVSLPRRSMKGGPARGQWVIAMESTVAFDVSGMAACPTGVNAPVVWSTDKATTVAGSNPGFRWIPPVPA